MKFRVNLIALAGAGMALCGLAARLPAQNILVSPTQLTFSATTGGSTGTQNLVVVSSTGRAETFSATAYSSSNWLAMTPQSGTTPQVLTVSVTPGALMAGSYGGFISVTADGATTSVSVILNVGSSGVSPFSASPNSLTFNFGTGATVSQNQQLTIGGATGGTFTATASTNTGGNWLSVNPNSGTTPESLSVSVNPSTLGGGIYYGSIAINAPGTTGLVAPVQVNVAAQGALNISPQQLSFAYQIGTTTPVEQTLTLTTTGTGVISFTASASSEQCGGNWLVVSPQSGAAPATLSVQINTTGLQQGTCDGTITINAPAAANSTISIPVTLLVSTNALLQAPTTGVTFTYQPGTAAPASQTVQVTSSSGALPFTVSAAPISGGPAFLTVSPASGTTPQAITISINSTSLASLAPNTYAETVTVSSPSSGNASVSFPVTLVVSNNPGLLLTQQAVTFNYQIGRSTPASQTVTLSSAGAPLGFTVSTSTSNCSGFLSASPGSGTTSIQSGQPTQVVLSVNTAGLTTPQTCSGTVTLSVPGNAPQTIPVTLNVSNTPLLNVSPAVINVTANAGSSSSTLQTISLTSTDNTTALNFLATASTSPAGLTWLSVSPNTGSTPASLNVIVNPVNLPAGAYMGSINISSSTGNVLPETIPMVLTVASGTVTVSSTSLSFNQSEGGANPASQTIQVTNVPPGATVGAVATTYSGSNFLSVATSGNTITVTANGSQLSQGTYSGVVTVFVPGTSNSPLYVQVSLTVGPEAPFTVTPTTLNFTLQKGGALPASQTVQLASSSGSVVSFNAVAIAPPGSTNGVVFVTVTPASGTTPGSLTVSLNQTAVSTLAAGSYADLINLTSASATGTTQTIPVTLTITTPGPPSITSIVNGASFQSGSVSPGEVISIFGTNIGPATPAGLTLTSTNTVATTLNTTSVTFNGVAAPLIYVSLNQINAIVPYEVAGMQSVPVVVTTGGTDSSSFMVNVAPSDPAIFSLSQNGSGQGAILDQNGSVNEAANPAAAGSVIVIYATGEGVTNPASPTGSVTPSTGTSFPLPSAAVSVMIGGVQAQILYAGEAPGLIAGVLQVNAVVPASIGAGNQPIVLTIGGVMSSSAVTAAIQ